MLNGRVHKIEIEHDPKIQVGLNRAGVGKQTFLEKESLGSFTEMIFNILWVRLRRCCLVLACMYYIIDGNSPDRV